MEVAAGRRVGGIGHLARQDDAVHVRLRIGLRDGGQQRLGVRMLGIAEQLLGLGQLDHLADVHHAHPVGDVLDDAEVVGDEQVGEVEFGLQILQQVEDLRLDGHVEGGHRLVTTDELRLRRERPGDADTLALAAGEGVRIALEVLDLQADGVHQLLDPIFQFLSARQVVGHQRLGDDVQYRHAWIQRRVGVLEDHLHVAADLPQPVLVQLGDVDRRVGGLELEVDRAVGGLDRAQDAAPQGRLAAAGLSHQAERLSLVDEQVDAVDGLDVTGDAAQEPLLDREVLAQLIHSQERSRSVFRGRSARGGGLLRASAAVGFAHRAAPNARRGCSGVSGMGSVCGLCR